MKKPRYDITAHQSQMLYFYKEHADYIVKAIGETIAAVERIQSTGKPFKLVLLKTDNHVATDVKPLIEHYERGGKKE